MRPVERVFIGDADASEAIYRLLKAAREGKRLQEEVRVAGLKGQPARWLRLRVRPLGDSGRDAASPSGPRRCHPRTRAPGECLSGIAARGRLSRSCAGRLLLRRWPRRVVYLNATLANWLDQDLAQVGSGGLTLPDLVAGDGAALLTTLRAAPGD